MRKKSIAEIKKLYMNNELTEETIALLKEDNRKGVKGIVNQFLRNRDKENLLRQQFYNMTVYERECWNEGQLQVAGVDEAGRGPLAGPVVAAAVILPKDFELIGLNDSKQIKETQREQFFDYIINHALAYSVSIIDNHKIDDVNIFEATKLAMNEALTNLSYQPDCALIDAVKLNNLPFATKEIIKGDQKSISIAAASILAKVTRDRFMKEIDAQYPGYGFKSNMGYGTKHHIEQLQMLGITPFHRKSFSPVKTAMKSE